MIRVRLSALLLATAVLAPCASSQTLRVHTDSARVTVGDPVVATVHVSLPSGAELVDRAPQVADKLSEGVRLASVDTLQRSGDEWVGHVRLLYFRAGAQRVPAFVLRYRRAPGGSLESLASAARPFVVASVLPPVNNTMRDIKELEYSALPLRRLALLALLSMGVAVAAWVFHRRRRARLLAAAAARAAAASAPLPPTAYENAISHLAAVVDAGFVAREEVDRHYALIAEVLREYLEEAHEVPALERTTGELLWSLPPRLAAPAMREACRSVLGESDLVKFARLRPSAAQAAAYAVRARALLDRWHAAAGAPADPVMADALR